jgi:hypothetical protein
MSRPEVITDYYTGQGRILIGKRDPLTGRIYDILKVGNCTALSVATTVDKTEHKESWSGDKGNDLTTYKGKSATGKFTAEDMGVDLLAMALWGVTATVAAGTATDVIAKAVRGGVSVLDHQNILTTPAPTLTVDVAGTPTPLVDGIDYALDSPFGTIHWLNPTSGGVIASTAVDDATAVDVTIGYSYGPAKRLEMFTEAVAPERYIRFEGLNGVDGSARLVEVWKALLDPLSGLEMITEEVGNCEVNFSMNRASGIVGNNKSKYYRETRVAAAA